MLFITLAFRFILFSLIKFYDSFVQYIEYKKRPNSRFFVMCENL